MRYYFRGIIISYLILLLACSANVLQKNTIDTTGDDNIKKKKNVDKKSETIEEKLKIIDKQPCWVNKDPNICKELKEDSKLYLFFATSMSNNLTNSKKSESSNSDLLKHLRGEYLSIIKSDVKSIVYDELLCKKQGGNNFCEQKYVEYIKVVSEGYIEPNEVELRDTYITKNIDAKNQDIYGLGCVLKTQYKKRINEFRVLIKEDQNNTFDSHSPKKTPASKPDFTWIRKEQCKDISFIDFTPSDNQVLLLNGEVKAMLNSEIKEGSKEGIYDDDRVLETNSEIYKDKKTKTPDVINYYEEATQKKMDRIIRCYEKKIRETKDNYSEKLMELFEKYNEESVKLTSFQKYLAEWEILIQQSLQYQSEIAELKRIFGERIRSLSHTYLTFTYANEKSTVYNEDVIKNYADQLVERELKDKEAQHYVTKQILINDNFAKVVLEDEYEVAIEKASTDGISFKPSSGCRAQIQKYLLLESSINRNQISVDIEPAKKIRAKTFIMLGYDDVQLMYNDDEKNYVCVNCEKLQNVYNILEKRSKEIYLDISKQKDKIQRFIKDVIMDNVQMVKTYLSLKKDFGKRLDNKKYSLLQNKEKINKIDNKMKKLLNLEYKQCILPDLVVNRNEIDQIKEKNFKQHEQKIRNAIDTTLSKLQEHKKNKEIIVFSVIDKTEELKIDALKKHIEEKYNNIIKTACSAVHKGKSISTNKGPFHTKEKLFRVTPMIKGYSFPALRIKLIEGTNSRHYSLAMALKVNCKECQDEYRFIPKSNEIYDVSNDFYWEVVEGNSMPHVRKNKESKPENSDYQVYLDFCEGYKSFLEKMTFSPYFQNWPRIKCLPSFVYNHSTKVIIDYENREQWEFADELDFANFIQLGRNKSMKVVSYEKLKQFLVKINKAINAGDIDDTFLERLRGKKFWTNSREGRRVSIIEFSNDSSIHEKLVKRDVLAYGLLYTRF